MDDFYCGHCGRRRPLADKISRPGKRPACKTCDAKAKSRAAARAKAQSDPAKPGTSVLKAKRQMPRGFVLWLQQL
jgi:hypothetical protein